MSTPFTAATAAYANAAKLMGNGGAKTANPLQEQGGDFASMLAQSVQSVVDTGNRSDNLQMQMLDGKANIVDVVTAVSETELAMESMVSVRDRVISAYEEIMRMPI
ncbi:MAG: flagellar hook-basal body complex protein FliE [Hyphomicrobiaceae bacterium]|nr:flagellar hook-basal body complex protein FliE [Hyphomicrobiaceae bacterium]MCC0024807.1 flagellar hook-basal body complex protein FliE [Hyphomicrobiaceae bacterium]